MSVSFNTIPGNIRVPLFYAEMDNAQASYFSPKYRALLIGQKFADAPAKTSIPTLISRLDQAKEQYGMGSMLTRMFESYRTNDDLNEVWCVAVDESATGVAAQGKIEIVGTATENGALAVYIAAQRLYIGVTQSDTAGLVATKLATAINALSDLPVTAAAVNTVVNLTTKWKGESGNDINVMMNYLGLAQGEKLPTGLLLNISKMSGGVGYPDLSAVIAKLGDEEYNFIVLPYTDVGSLDAIGLEMNDQTGRWSYGRQIYGHVYAAKRGTLSALQKFGQSRNDPHVTIAGLEPSVPAPVWEFAAQYGARNAKYISLDPARPTQTGELLTVLPAPAGERFMMTERQTLLSSGVATSYVGAGVVRIERAITTYQKNKWNQPDPSYLDSETLHTSAYVMRFLRQRITSKYGRHKLANDGTRFGAGQAIVTPQVIRGELIAAYRELEYLGIVENAALFSKHLIVERPASDPNRINVLLPPDYVNQLRVFAVLNQFRLAYPQAA